MSEPKDIFLGFDPGGKGRGRGNFGWSICRDNDGEFEQLHSGLGRYAGEVVEQVRANLPKNAYVRAAGIDAPMFWDRTGRLYRNVDEIIRNAGRLPVSTNGLYGAVLAQGVLVAVLLRDHFGDLAITETFPSALRGLLDPIPPQLVQIDNETPHQCDARTAAYAAWCMNAGGMAGWQDLLLCEPEPYHLIDPPASYWMPIPQAPPV
jgi:predicted nuclease with RNAse H fold